MLFFLSIPGYIDNIFLFGEDRMFFFLQPKEILYIR